MVIPISGAFAADLWTLTRKFLSVGVRSSTLVYIGHIFPSTRLNDVEHHLYGATAVFKDI